MTAGMWAGEPLVPWVLEHGAREGGARLRALAAAGEDAELRRLAWLLARAGDGLGGSLGARALTVTAGDPVVRAELFALAGAPTAAERRAILESQLLRAGIYDDQVGVALAGHPACTATRWSGVYRFWPSLEVSATGTERLLAATDGAARGTLLAALVAGPPLQLADAIIIVAGRGGVVADLLGEPVWQRLVEGGVAGTVLQRLAEGRPEVLAGLGDRRRAWLLATLPRDDRIELLRHLGRGAERGGR